MPVKPTYPGVYIEELPSGVRTITGVSTSVAAFVDSFPRGLRDEASGIRRAVVPSSMWPWSGRCLAGGTVEDLRRELPQISVEVVDVPARVLATSLSVDECWDYINAHLDVPMN